LGVAKFRISIALEGWEIIVNGGNDENWSKVIVSCIMRQSIALTRYKESRIVEEGAQVADRAHQRVAFLEGKSSDEDDHLDQLPYYAWRDTQRAQERKLGLVKKRV